LLGRGGMGAVFKAHDRVLDEGVALKVLRPELAHSAGMAQRFRSEIKLARRVRHENVCGIHEYGQDGDLHFIAMELIEGDDLKTILRARGMLPPPEAYHLALGIGRGLQAIHLAGIIHRDLKTPNIMVDQRGVVRLMDFGIARSVDPNRAPETSIGSIVGTPEYMSPEQGRGETLDFRSDVYAFGIVLFEMFTGAVPFHGDTPVTTILKHLQEPPPLEQNPHLPEELVPILRRALGKSRSDRFETVGGMGTALEQARGSSSTVPRTTLTNETAVPLTYEGETVDTELIAASTRAPRSGQTVASDTSSAPVASAMSRRTLAVASLVGATVLAISWLSQPLAAPPPPRSGISLAAARVPAEPVPASLASREPISSGSVAPPTLEGVFVGVRGASLGVSEASSLIDARLRALKILRLSTPDHARYELSVVVDSSSRDNQLYGTSVTTNLATATLRGVDRLSGQVLFDYASPTRTNTIQDSSVGRSMAAREAVLAVFEAHADIARLLTGEPRGNK
jgi:serine/threonine protein kinase